MDAESAKAKKIILIAPSDADIAAAHALMGGDYVRERTALIHSRLHEEDAPSDLMGIKIVVDETMPSDTMELRTAKSFVRVINLATEPQTIQWSGEDDFNDWGEPESDIMAAIRDVARGP